jgi:hypothetical protein
MGYGRLIPHRRESEGDQGTQIGEPKGEKEKESESEHSETSCDYTSPYSSTAQRGGI